MSDTFDKHFGRIMLIAAASVFGGGAIRVGTDKLTDEVAKLRELFQNHEVRIANLETLVLTPKPPTLGTR